MRSSNNLLRVMMGYALFAMVWVVPERDDAIIAMDPLANHVESVLGRRILNPAMVVSAPRTKVGFKSSENCALGQR
jgi:hypothetical protein